MICAEDSYWTQNKNSILRYRNLEDALQSQATGGAKIDRTNRCVRKTPISTGDERKYPSQFAGTSPETEFSDPELVLTQGPQTDSKLTDV